MRLREGYTVYLESIGPEHAEKIFEWYYDINYQNFFREFEAPLTIENCKDFGQMMLRSGVEAFMIMDKETGEAMGIMTMCILKKKPGVCRAGLMLDKKFQHKTHTIESLIIIGDYIFNKRGFNKGVVEFLDSDKHIQRITEFGGFIREGLLKDEAIVNDKYVDEVRYAIFKSTYEKLYGSYFDELEQNS